MKNAKKATVKIKAGKALGTGTSKVTIKPVKPTQPPAVIEFKKYRVTSAFEMNGQTINPNQAIVLSDVLAKEYSGHIKLL